MNSRYSHSHATLSKNGNKNAAFDDQDGKRFLEERNFSGLIFFYGLINVALCIHGMTPLLKPSPVESFEQTLEFKRHIRKLILYLANSLCTI